MKFLKRAEILRGTVIAVTNLGPDRYYGLWHSGDSKIINQVLNNDLEGEIFLQKVEQARAKNPNLKTSKQSYSYDLYCDKNSLFSANEDVLEVNISKKDILSMIDDLHIAIATYSRLCSRFGTQDLKFVLDSYNGKTMSDLGNNAHLYVQEVFIESLVFASSINDQDMFSGTLDALVNFVEKEPFITLSKKMSTAIKYNHDNYDLIAIYASQFEAILNEDFEQATEYKKQIDLLTK